MNSDTIMKFGPHRGKRLLDVPAQWLLNTYDEETVESLADTNIGVTVACIEQVFAYIKENRAALERECQDSELRRRAWSKVTS